MQDEIQSPPQKPINFWRRSFAWVIDVIIIYTMTTLIIAPFSWAYPSIIKAPSFPLFSYHSQSILEEIDPRYEPFFPQIDGFQQYATQINSGSLPIYPKTRVIQLFNQKANFKLYISFEIDKAGNPIFPKDYTTILFAILWFFFTPWLRSRKTTSFGKKLLYLKLEPNSSISLKYFDFFKREFLRSWILIVTILGALISMFTTGFDEAFLLATKEQFEAFGESGDLQQLGGQFQSLLGIGVFLNIIIAVWLVYILVLCVKKHRRMPWDLWAGTRVERVSSQ